MPIPASEMAAALRAFKASFNGIMDDLVDNLVSGRITLGMWEEDMRTRLREYLYGSAMIGKGDPLAMSRSDKGWVGAELQKQYRWLHKFAWAIYEKKDSITAAAIKARSYLYAEAGTKVANGIMAGALRDLLSWIPGDKNAACMHRCSCMWLNAIEDIAEDVGMKTVSSVWVLNALAEHCEDCEPRDGHTEVNTVPINTVIPPFIGLGGV